MPSANVERMRNLRSKERSEKAEAAANASAFTLRLVFVVLVVFGLVLVLLLFGVDGLRRRTLPPSEASPHTIDARVTADATAQHGQQVSRFADVIHEAGALHEKDVSDFVGGMRGAMTRLVQRDSPEADSSRKIFVEHASA